MIPTIEQPSEVIKRYFDNGYKPIFWPPIGDSKGPREAEWPQKRYTLEDYKDGYRVGLLTGCEVAPGKFLHDVDIDWAPGAQVATKLLPTTNFVYGRPSKRISHCFYTCEVALPTTQYTDIDKSMLVELRGTKQNGDLGFQSMVPPSIWTKEEKTEPLVFIRDKEPGHLDSQTLKKNVLHAAIAMLLAKHLGKNGFGHEPRLAWAGYLLRAGILPEDLIVIGEAISSYCNNTEVDDVRRVVESTSSRLHDRTQKIKGGKTLATLLGDQGKAVVKKINEWLGKDSDFIRNPDGAILKDNQENIRRATNALGIELSYNEFSDKMYIQASGGNRMPLDDRQMNELWLRIDDELKFRPTFQFFEKVIQRIGFDNSFHPVKQYLDGLVWDGVPRIHAWLERYCGAIIEDPNHRRYIEAIGPIFLVAAVRRIRQPGCKYDEMIVFESGQGLEKSTALSILAVNRDWFTDDLPLNLRSQQLIEATLGKWIIEASDLAGKGKAEIESLKAMLSRQVDGPARMAYAHLPIERLRCFVFIGTTNKVVYLLDSTGSRRFWPVKVTKFDLEALRRDRDQLWAEAAARESEGASIRLAPELWEEAAKHQESRREVDAWEDEIVALLEAVQVGGDGRKRIQTKVLWETLAIDPAKRDRLGSMRISEIMQRLGYERTRVHSKEFGVQVGYVSQPIKLDLESAIPTTPE